MQQLQGTGHAVGKYVGDGGADMEHEDEEGAEGSDGEFTGEDFQPNIEDGQFEERSADVHPLLFLFDTETTGLSIYNDHIIEIASKVTGISTSTITQPSFSSLVHTSNIASIHLSIHMCIHK